MDFKVVIPARYGSTRLPGKPLLPIAGKPMIVHVVERALASGAGAVVVAFQALGRVHWRVAHGVPGGWHTNRI